MLVSILKWVVVVSASINFGFMAFDGTRALVIGDYIRPQSGEYAGQLGPWSKLVSAIGIDPESDLMKTTFVLLGIIGIGLTACFAFNVDWAWQALLVMSIGTLWYLVPGTALSVLQITLLLVIRFLP